MFDKELIQNILLKIFDATQKIFDRSLSIADADSFSNSPEGMEKLDSICMLFIVIGESLKQIDKITNKEFLKKYPEIDWRGVKGFRDIISHNYFDIDTEQVFWVCKKEVPRLLEITKRMLDDLKSENIS